jgi:uncharacterized radical SAM superfamily Fe-S cluster-containing enzyme
VSAAQVLEWLLTTGADAAWRAGQLLNRTLPGPGFKPAWAPGALRKSWQKSHPPLGWPRTTDSLCPACVKAARARILAHDVDVEAIVRENVGELKAHILERDGRIVMEKTCPVHGTIAETLSTDPDFTRRIEGLFPGRDFESVAGALHNHGVSAIQYGRGAVLTIDLTNRCNMMCDPCFMDANQVGFVHELTFDEVKKLLDDSLTIQPRRQMTVQFSGGEPTISPIFLDAVAYAKTIGYFSVQAATNGIRFAQDPELASRARAAGLRIAYLQFDGVGEDANAHRKVKNLFEVKLRAIENLHAAGIDVCLVVTVVRSVNDSEVGHIVKFAIENADRISFVSFQPVSFTGRDEDIDDETRARQRYTLADLAHDMKRQTGATEPLRDWYPLSAAGPLADVTDLLKGPGADWGTLKCGCHPNCGIGTALMVNKRTKTWAPLSSFVDIERFFRDATLIADAARRPWLTKLQVALSLLRNYHPMRAPEGLTLRQLLKKFDKQSGGALGGGLNAEEGGNRKADEWLILFVAGMWFQDLWTYDFRRTEMCIIPYATQLGEVSFCAYNTGVGWRHIVEAMHQNATVAEWFKVHGRHEVFANPRKSVTLPEYQPVTLKIPRDGVLVDYQDTRRPPETETRRPSTGYEREYEPK